MLLIRMHLSEMRNVNQRKDAGVVYFLLSMHNTCARVTNEHTL